MRLCPLCDGVGEVPTVWDPSRGMLAIFDTRKECPECKGCCMVPGTALLRNGYPDPTVTRGYIWELYHLASAYRDGWDAANMKHFSRVVVARSGPTYADLRDYLHSLFDADALSVAQVALYLAFYETWDNRQPSFDFSPIV